MRRLIETLTVGAAVIALAGCGSAPSANSTQQLQQHPALNHALTLIAGPDRLQPKPQWSKDR